MGKVVPFRPKFDPKRVPHNATKADFGMLIEIFAAASRVSDAKIAFLKAMKTFHDAHPEHETPGALLTAYGIDPHDLDNTL